MRKYYPIINSYCKPQIIIQNLPDEISEDEKISLDNQFYVKKINCELFEIVRLPDVKTADPVVFIVDEEGMISGLQRFNYVASRIYSRLLCGGKEAYLFGPAIIARTIITPEGEEDLDGFDSYADAKDVIHKIFNVCPLWDDVEENTESEK